MSILAIDLGTHFGWATIVDGYFGASGHVDLKAYKGVHRFKRFQACVSDLITNNTDETPRVIAYEKVMAHRGTAAAHMYGAFEVLLQLIGDQHRASVQGYGVGEIKKFATGKGNAKKDKMVAAARKIKHDVTDDNEADAIFIALLAHSKAMKGQK